MPSRSTGVSHPNGAADNVAASVRAATEALTQLHRSLEHGGFAEGAAAYERMAELLLTQRMWVESEGVPLQGEFELLGDVARRTYAMLEPYATAMKRLAILAPSDDEVARRQLLEALNRRGGRGATRSTLSRELRIERSELDGLLETLVEDGIVSVRGSGNAALYAMGATREGRHARKSGSGARSGGSTP